MLQKLRKFGNQNTDFLTSPTPLPAGSKLNKTEFYIPATGGLMAGGGKIHIDGMYIGKAAAPRTRDPFYSQNSVD